jgi:hypothetical protein
MKLQNTIVPILLLCTINFASVLGDLAKSVPERTFVKLPANSNLGGLCLTYSLFYYNDSGCWDPVNKRIQWIGSGGSCCNNQCGDALGQHYLMTYGEANNSWAIKKAPWGGSGHGFDGNTMDPATGDHYYSKFGSTVVHKLKGGKYSALPNIPYAKVATVGIAWFPELNSGRGGLVHVSGSGKLSWFDGTKWTVISRPSTPWGSYATFAEYNPAKKVVWLGGGRNGGRVTYTLNTQLNLTRMPDAPFELRPNESLCSVDPVSGKCIATQTGTNTWYELDVTARKWTRLTNIPGMPSNSPNMQVPIPELGVIYYFRHKGSAREAWLYRHRKGSTVNTESMIKGSLERISVAPNPFSSTTVIKIRSKEVRNKEAKIKIFDVTGNLCFFTSLLPASLDYSWNTAGLPAGVYIVKAFTGKEQITKKIYLMK